MPVRKIPMRRCMGCDTSRPKNELTRIVRTPEGGVTLDPTGKLNGRGAYLCRDAECLRKVRKSRRVERTLEVAVPDEVWDALEKELSNG